MSQVANLEKSEGWKWVRCASIWLESADYPVLLGSANLGISLHTSSSGLDLPMKVVDMFGCGLPVCALNFPCLDELVRDGVNGLTFQTAEQLAEQFEVLLTSFPRTARLNELRESLAGMQWGTWSDNWDRVVLSLVLSDVDHFAEHRMDELAARPVEDRREGS